MGCAGKPPAPGIARRRRITRMGYVERVGRATSGGMELTMELLETMNVIEDQEWLEAPSATVAEAVSKLLTQPGGRPTPLSDFLNGVWLGHPLHPLLTD